MRKPTGLLAVLLTAVLAVSAVLAVPAVMVALAAPPVAEMPAACREDATRIHAVQGSGAASPLV
ncbi:MAG TPA: hypothetical protein PLG36_11165, partial [Trueperaceae bacterium]|nr:hypothetical protein [Trueperaceae bacterium]